MVWPFCTSSYLTPTHPPSRVGPAKASDSLWRVLTWGDGMQSCPASQLPPATPGPFTESSLSKKARPHHTPAGSKLLPEIEGQSPPSPCLLSHVRPPQRPTAKELLKHKFITRHTKKTSFLTELIDRYKRWKSEGHGEESSSEDSDM